MTKSARGNEGLVVPVSGCFPWSVVNSVIVNGVNVKYALTPTKPMCGSTRGITLLSEVVELKKLELLFLVFVALLLLNCCFTSTETVGLLGTGVYY